MRAHTFCELSFVICNGCNACQCLPGQRVSGGEAICFPVQNRFPGAQKLFLSLQERI